MKRMSIGEGRVLSRCFACPIPVGCFSSSLDWAVPISKVEGQSASIRSWARPPGRAFSEIEAVLTSWDWLLPWLRDQFVPSHVTRTVASLAFFGFTLPWIAALNGDIEQVISCYLGHMEAKSIQPLAERVDRAGKGKLRLVGLDISGNGIDSVMLSTGAPACFVFDVDQVRPGMWCYFTIYNLQGHQLANFHSGGTAQRMSTMPDWGRDSSVISTSWFLYPAGTVST